MVHQPQLQMCKQRSVCVKTAGRSVEGAFKVMFLPFTPRLRSVHCQLSMPFFVKPWGGNTNIDCINIPAAFNHLRTNSWYWCWTFLGVLWPLFVSQVLTHRPVQSKQDTFGLHKVDGQFLKGKPIRGQPQSFTYSQCLAQGHFTRDPAARFVSCTWAEGLI